MNWPAGAILRPSLTFDPRHIHDRSGIFMGSWDEVEKVKKFHS